MKKILLIVLAMILATTAFSQTYEIATFPFTGSEIKTTEEGEYLAGLFTAEFIPLGYNLVSRTTGLGISAAERNYQSTGATSEIAEIGKQVAADYVLVGSLNKVFGSTSLKAEVIGVESSQIVASATKTIASLNDLSTVSVEMVANLDAQIKGVLPTAKAEAEKVMTLEGFSTRTEEELLLAELDGLRKGKWAGRWTWIGGLASITTGSILMMSTSWPEQPDQNDYFITDSFGATYDQAAYDQAYAQYEDMCNEASNYSGTASILLSVGVVAVLAGGITDIVFSVREKNFLEDLEAQGLYLTATPTFVPSTNGVSFAMNFGAKYTF